MENMDYTNIPKEKFKFAQRTDLHHDSKFDTKPVGYFQGAFRRFCKNKGAVVGGIVIAFLILFAIIAPFCTPYTPSYYDEMYASARPKCAWFEETDFWDGCREKTDVGYVTYLKDYALGLETGKDVIKNHKIEISEDGKSFTYRFDTYHGVGFGNYRTVSLEEYLDIQRWQDETGRQVLYPIVKKRERPSEKTFSRDHYDANIWYKFKIVEGKIQPAVNADGQLENNYWKERATSQSTAFVPYTSKMRLEGEDGFMVDDVQYYYVYGRTLPEGVEVRADYFEYYTYKHSQVLKDGIEEPYFLFGTTGQSESGGGKDIFACLAHGARFSFIFATLVAVANFIVGVIYGSIAGYFGGKVDLFMERFSEILGSVPTMIVITLLKYYIEPTAGGADSRQALILFIAFFMTGWIGMAGTTRMQFYRFKNQEYILAARTLGARDTRIMFKHIFPNGLGTIVTASALVIPSMIYTETNLSYLGIIDLESGNTTSVGTLIAAGQRDVLYAPYVAFFPCFFLVLLMLSFNLFGNGLRDAFNPSLRGSEE